MEGKKDLFSLGSSSTWTWPWLLRCSWATAEGSSFPVVCSWLDDSVAPVLWIKASPGGPWATLGSGDGGGVGTAPAGLGDVVGLRYRGGLESTFSPSLVDLHGLARGTAGEADACKYLPTAPPF